MNLMSARNWQVLESKTKGKEGVGRHGGWSSGGFAHGGLCVKVTRLKEGSEARQAIREGHWKALGSVPGGSGE